MSNYSQLKNKINARTRAIEDALIRLEALDLLDSSQSERWREQLLTVQSSLHESLLRVAVVGSVKSGKSTLINALVGADLLKRGAGITTAFITRIRDSQEAGGWIELKSWSRINQEINNAARMLPIFAEQRDQQEPLDLRRAQDRMHLKQWLSTTQEEWQQMRGQLDPNFLLLHAYLEGFDKIKDMIGDSVNRLLFNAGSMAQHQRFVAQESQAVYIQDMELHHTVPHLGAEIEIADCQGSDSPNPLHIALVQQYLLRSHFILYVIGSRTGLREADFKLLDFIKTLRMFSQTHFVLNVDLDSHSDYQDIKESVQRVRRELNWVVAKPQLFAFSALYRLLGQLGDGASGRDRDRLKMWQQDQRIVEQMEQEFETFQQQLAHRISHQRTRVLFGSGLSRLAMITGTVLDNAQAQQAFLEQNLGDLRKSAKGLENRHHSLNATLTTLENAISGLQDTLRKELDDAVHGYFDLKTGPIIQETLAIVDNYPLDPKYLRDLADPRHVLRRLHYFYLEFRQSLAQYLVEKVNLQIIEFAKEQEVMLEERLTHSSRAFWSLFRTAMDDYRRELAKHRIELRSLDVESFSDWSLQEKVTPPPFSGFVAENALGRGVLIMKFGIGRLSRFLGNLKNRLGKREHEDRISERDETLKEAVSLVKSETKAELIYAFRDYRQNFKYGYLFKLLDTATRLLLDEFKTRAEMTALDFANLFKHREMEEERRVEAIKVLKEVTETAQKILEELDGLRCAINLEWLAAEDNATSDREEAPSDQAELL